MAEIKSKSYQESLLASLRDPQEAAEYLNAALEESDENVFLLALNNVAQANGFSFDAVESANPTSFQQPKLNALLNTLHLRFATAAK